MKGPMKARWVDETISFEPPDPSALPEEARRFFDENVALRLEANGQTFPEGVTLRRTGQLLDTARAEAGQVVYPAEYAPYVHARYNWAGIPPQRQEEWTRRIAPLVLPFLVSRPKP